MTEWVEQWICIKFCVKLEHSSMETIQLIRQSYGQLVIGSFIKTMCLLMYQGAKSGLQGGWVTWVIWCFTKKLCTRHDVWASALLWWSCQSPVAHSCSLLNHLNTFCGGTFKLQAKFDTDSLFYSLSHFEWDGHTVYMLTQWHLLFPLTSTVKSSLFMHVHSSPLSSAARLHQCCAIFFCYINNGWTFFRTDCIYSASWASTIY